MNNVSWKCPQNESKLEVLLEQLLSFYDRG